MTDHFGPPLPTVTEAREAGRMGWNLRCNSCGGYGATWIPKMRPGWGSLALCHPHADELYAMQRRHADELATLTTVNFEQDRQRRREMTRRDITPEDVARRWLAGESILSLASDLLVSEELIKRRIRKARQDFPDLPWDERPKGQTRSSVRDYREMKDGVPGARPLKTGSIVYGRGVQR